jgi:hypothetical protein
MGKIYKSQKLGKKIGFLEKTWVDGCVTKYLHICAVSGQCA